MIELKRRIEEKNIKIRSIEQFFQNFRLKMMGQSWVNKWKNSNIFVTQMYHTHTYFFGKKKKKKHEIKSNNSRVKTFFSEADMKSRDLPPV